MLINSQLAAIVRHLLISHEHLRDDDHKLIANIWNRELRGEAHEKTAFEFLSLFANRELTNPESIRRIRQKLQETEPLLRGKNFEKRHKIATEFSTFIKT